MGEGESESSIRTTGPHYGRVPWFEPDELTPEQRAFYDALTGGRRNLRGNSFVDKQGRLTGGFNAQLLSPRVGHAVQNVSLVLRHDGNMTPREQEIAILEVARAEASTYVWIGHTRHAKKAGLSEAAIDAIQDGEDAPELSDQERLVRRVVQALTTDGDLDDPLFEAARDGLGLAKLFDVVAIYGYYRQMMLSLRVWRVPPRARD